MRLLTVKKTIGSNMDTQQCYIGKGRSLKGNHVRPARTESTLKHNYLLFTRINWQERHLEFYER